MCYYSLPQVVPVLGSPMTTLPPLLGRMSIISLLALPHVVPVPGSPMTTLPPPGRTSTISLLVLLQVVSDEGLPRPIVLPGLASMMSRFPQVVPVDGSPMTTLPPLLGRMSMMSRLGLPQVVLEEGFPRPIVEPGVVEMRSGWGFGVSRDLKVQWRGVGSRR